jgi:multiple sugar transport system ATP-binding protein
VTGIQLDEVTKVYGNGVKAVDQVSLDINEGEFMVLVGPSGCGKSTLLRMIAGLEDVTDGAVFIGDVDVTDKQPQQRDIAMVFQNYALYPHMSVRDNLAYGLKIRKLPKQEWRRRVDDVAKTLGLDELLDRKPAALSGGQRQRVAMGRAIVREPQAFLMDEPLSNLDAKLRTQMRAEIGLLHKELGITTIYVTHDQVEAMTLGQRVAVMRKGDLQQVDAPQVLYDRPSNLFVAGFIGSPAMNFFEAEFERADGRVDVVFGEQRLAVADAERERHGDLTRYEGRKVIVGVRPEHLEDAAVAGDTPSERRFHGLVQLTELLGSEVVVHLQVEAVPAVTEEVREIAQDVDEAALDDLDHQRRRRRTAFVGRFDIGTRAREDEQAEIAVAPGALRFFDAETGQALGAGAA